MTRHPTDRYHREGDCAGEDAYACPICNPRKVTPRWHIPWTAPQFWRQKLTSPDFPYCRGKLAADKRTMKWLILANPTRAEPHR